MLKIMKKSTFEKFEKDFKVAREKLEEKILQLEKELNEKDFKILALKEELEHEKDKYARLASQRKDKNLELTKKWLNAYPGEKYDK